MATIVARVPGRVILARTPDRNDAVAVSIDRHLEITAIANPAREVVRMASDREHEHAVVPIELGDRSPSTFDGWAAEVAAVVASARPLIGYVGKVRSTIPAGVGFGGATALRTALALVFSGRVVSTGGTTDRVDLLPPPSSAGRLVVVELAIGEPARTLPGSAISDHPDRWREAFVALGDPTAVLAEQDQRDLPSATVNELERLRSIVGVRAVRALSTGHALVWCDATIELDAAIATGVGPATLGR